MNKYIIILLLGSIYCFSQPKIGCTLNEFKHTYKNEEIDIEMLADTTIATSFDNPELMAFYFFDGITNKCYASTIYPKNKQLLNSLLIRFDKEFTSVDYKTWRYLVDKKYVKVVFDYSEDKKPRIESQYE